MLLFNTPEENLEEKRAELLEEYDRAYKTAKDRQKRLRKYGFILLDQLRLALWN